MSGRKPNADEKPQHDRFVETARKLGCDESEEAFDEKLKVIARAKPSEPRAKPVKPRRNPDK